LLLEKALHYALNHLKLQNAHNPFNEAYHSHNGLGVDNIIHTCKGNIENECKNPNGKHQLSKAWIKQEVLSRYGYKPFIKVLTVSILNVSRKVKRLIESKGIRIIQLGYQVTKHNFSKAVHDLIKKLHWIKVKYAKYVGKKPSSQQVKLSHFDSGLLYNGCIIDVGFCGYGFSFNVKEYGRPTSKLKTT